MKLKYLSLGANYKPPYNLAFAESDASAIYELFQTQNLYPDVESKLLQSEATAESICETVKAYSQNCSPTDCLLFYFAGHGLVEEDGKGVERLYLVNNNTNPKFPDKTAVRLNEILKHFENSKANIAVILLDCCFSGYGGRSILGPKILKKIQTGRTLSIPVPVVRGYGRMILAACGRNEKALESSAHGHGLFTAALLETLSPKSSERSIAISAIYHFTKSTVLQLSGGRQCPSIYGGDHGAHLPTLQKLKI